MALDLWFREDVTRILASTYETLRASTAAQQRSAERSRPDALPHTEEQMTSYQQGFLDALRAVAVAFGLGPADRGRCPDTGWRPADRLAPYSAWGEPK